MFKGYLKILRMTLMHGADLKSTNRYGGTALIPAAERGHVETVRTLIAAGVNVNHVNNLGWTALLEAIILGNGNSNYQQIVAL
jgi:ankyrin repeat protein